MKKNEEVVKKFSVEYNTKTKFWYITLKNKVFKTRDFVTVKKEIMEQLYKIIRDTVRGANNESEN